MTTISTLSVARRGLLAGATMLLFAQGAALGQENSSAPETVVVTGTRIPRPEFDLPNPTMTVGSEQIQNSGTLDLGDYLKRIPALVGSLGSYQTNGYATPASNDGSSLGGLNLLDLRNLGYVRTLVLSTDTARSVNPRAVRRSTSIPYHSRSSTVSKSRRAAHPPSTAPTAYRVSSTLY